MGPESGEVTIRCPTFENLLDALRAQFVSPVPVSALASPLGASLIEVLRSQIGLGEVGCNNGGPHVATWKCLPEDSPGDLGPWCASLVSWGLVAAGFDPEAHGIPMRGVDGWARRRHSARWLFGTMARLGTRLSEPEVGALVLWPRGPVKSWQGHIGVAIQSGVIVYRTIEGNHGPHPSPVAEIEHSYDEARVPVFCRLP